MDELKQELQQALQGLREDRARLEFVGAHVEKQCRISNGECAVVSYGHWHFGASFREAIDKARSAYAIAYPIAA